MSFLKNNQKLLIILLTAIVAIKVMMLDQLTKTMVAEYFESHSDNIAITSFFNITLYYNKGISFGLFHDTNHANLILSGIVMIIIVALWIWFIRGNMSIFNILPIGWISGGAIGNLIDRFTRAGVLDFIDIHYHDWHYPIFNIADSAIVCGVGILIMKNIIFDKHPQKLV